MKRRSVFFAIALCVGAATQPPAARAQTDARLAQCTDRARTAPERAVVCRAIAGVDMAGNAQPGLGAADPEQRRVAAMGLGDALTASGDWAGLLAFAEGLLKLDPADRPGHALRGQAYINRGQPGDAERARDAYDEALRHHPGIFLFANNRGVARTMLGDANGALADHSLALELQPDYVPALIARSRLLNTRNDHVAALADVETGLRTAPENVPLLDEQARALIGLGRPREAIAALDKATALNPQRPMLHWRRAMVRAELSEADAAIADFTREIAVNPQLAGAYVHRGRLLLDARKDLDRARADFDKAIEIAPDFAMGWSQRSRAGLMAGNARGAETDARRALTLDPADVIAKHTLAGLADMKGDTAQALKLLDEVVAALPAIVETRLEQIAILMRLGRNGEALQSVRAGRALAPTNLDLIDLEAATQLKLGRVADGKADLDRAIAQGHRRASTHANRAAFAVYLRDFPLAESDVAAALRLDAKHLEANAIAGLLALRASDLRRADVAATAALAVDAGHGMALAVKAEVLRQQGRTAETDRTLALARAKDPRFAEMVRMIMTR